jgi:oligoribonuclease
MAESDRLVWMDLEMSGLDPESCRILEVAVLITDGQLEVVAEGPAFAVRQPESVLSAMDAWNTEHHGKSGLIHRVRESQIHEAEAEQRLLEFVRRHAEPRTAPLAGNSIHQDRRFLVKYFPTFEAHLHYRNVDVSTVKELVRRWYPEVFDKRPHKKGTHRALDDILDSIEELRFYRERVFRSDVSGG